MPAHGLRLLFADPDPDALASTAAWFSQRRHQVETALTFDEAVALAARGGFDVIVAPPTFSDEPAGELISSVRAVSPASEVLALAEHGSISEAVRSVKLGACDYLLKPIAPEQLERRCLEAAESSRLHRGAGREPRTGGHEDADEMIGRSPAMMELARLIRRVGPSDKPVLVEGESGTGKELVARALQRASTRSGERFVVVNCAALPDQLIESEFFGHERGAFTGATAAKPGLFETADRGTLFIDEVGELAPPLQAKFLRVLEDGTFRRVGSVTERRADVRVIAATNRDLSAEVAAGRFREDLYYRINVVSLRLPPLRERRGDVPRLVDAFLGRDWLLDADARRAVDHYGWPGNVRQLKNALERAKVLANGNLIRLCDLPTEVAVGPARQPLEASGDDIETRQREHVLKVLAREQGNKSRAARVLGVDRRSLYRLLDRYGRDGSRGRVPT